MERARLYDFAARVSDLGRQEEVDAATVEVLDAFHTAGVRSLLLKGPVLARLLYRSDEHRGYRDIDVLVPPTHFAHARVVLAELGYHNVSEAHGIDDVAGILHDETWLRYRPDVPMVTLDLHWRLAGCEADPGVTWAALERRQTVVVIAGRRVAALDRVGLALHLAIHAVQHGERGLKAVADLTRGIERWPLDTWRSAAVLAREVQATAALAAGLRLDPAGAVLADELGLAAIDERTWAILHRDARPRGAFHVEALMRAHGIRARANVVRRALLPTREWIAWEYRCASRGSLWLLAGYAMHVMRAPLWAARAWRFRGGVRRAVRRLDGR